MARRHRRRRHSYRGMGGLVSIPGLGGLLDAFKTPVVKSLGLGLAGGLVGAIGARMVLNKIEEKSTLPMWVDQSFPLLGGLGVGALAYALTKKKNSAKAKLLLAGSALGGGLVFSWNLLRMKLPSLGLSDYVTAPSMSGYVTAPSMGGVLFDNPDTYQNTGMGGVLFDNPLPRPASLGELMDAAIDDSAEDVAQASAP